VTTIFCIQPKGFNVGNDAIHLALRHLIDEAFGRVVNIISVPATKRYESHSRAGLTPRTVYEINQYGDGVIVGGGNLYENGELDLDLDALDVLEVPLLLFSLSWGRIHNRAGKLVRRTDAMPDRVISALDARADYSLTRDIATLEHLQSIGCAKAVFGGCPTVLLDRIVHLLPPVADADRDLTLISVRTPELMSIAPERQARVHGQIEAIVAYLRGAGHENIRLLCHDHRDISFATSFPGIEYVYTGDVYRYLALLRACRLNVGFRLHAGLPCLAFDRPAVNVSYDERAASAMRSMGVEAWDVSLVEEADPVARVIERIEGLEDLRARRKQAADVWARQHEVMASTLAAFRDQILARRGSP